MVKAECLIRPCGTPLCLSRARICVFIVFIPPLNGDSVALGGPCAQVDQFAAL